MTTRSHSILPGLARVIAWEIWSRNRRGFIALVSLLGLASLVNWGFVRDGANANLAASVGYGLLALALLGTFGFFHYTEGQRRGGFGCFPRRLFTLPVATGWLVGLPMAYGVATVVVVYAAGAGLLFVPLGIHLPVVWPCLYLTTGFAAYQAIIWSLAERRYLKLLGLSLTAMALTFAWMFFMPHMIEGTLSDWGYTGSPAEFQRRLLVALLLAGPAAFALSLRQVSRQRHGGPSRPRPWSALLDFIAAKALTRRAPFASIDHALFWQEWRQAGFVLPMAVGAVLAMTCLPAYLSGPLSANATMGMLMWLLIAPLLLGAIVGRAFVKPDFWQPGLQITPFAAIRPVSGSQVVFTKLKVAGLSVALAWAMVMIVSFVWTAHAGDLEGLDQLYRDLKLYYPPSTRWVVVGLTGFAVMLLSWRLMINGLAVGLSGRASWYVATNSVFACILVGLLAMMIFQSDHADKSWHLYDVWPVITRLPLIITAVVIGKLFLAAWAWNRAVMRGLVERKATRRYFALWFGATLPLAILAGVAFPNTPWLRNLLMMIALLPVPLTGPALAMLALARNRSA